MNFISFNFIEMHVYIHTHLSLCYSLTAFCTHILWLGLQKIHINVHINFLTIVQKYRNYNNLTPDIGTPFKEPNFCVKTNKEHSLISIINFIMIFDTTFILII